MLYSEFLEGTKAKDNRHTWKEYKRIEEIYISNPNMTKEKAYKLYGEPDELTAELLESLENAHERETKKASEVLELKKEIESLKQKLESKESVIKSLNFTLEECLKESQILTSRISNLIYG